jgi:protein CpxP
MKKYILSIILFVAVYASTFAQKGKQKNPEERAKAATEMMAKDLSLTPEQKTKIYAAALERATSIDALRTAAGEGSQPDASQMKAIGQKFTSVVQETLTDEQKELQKAKAEEMKAKKAANNGGN